MEGSLFCERHRAQAAFFSRNFGAAPPPGETPAPPTTPGLAVAPAVPQPVLPPGVNRAVELTLDAFAELSRGVDLAAPTDRWPQISIYCLQNQLLARTYYSVVPQIAAAAAAPRFNLQHPALRAAMAPSGTLLKEIATHFAAHEAELRRQEAQTLDLHFLTYAGLVAINLHRAGQRDLNLASLEVEEAGLRPAPLDAVRARLFHKRW